MEKIKSVFSKVVEWVKSHLAIVGIILAVVVVLIVAVNFVGGAEKRAINKYISAINSCDDEKIIKAMNLEASIAWSEADSYLSDSDDVVGDFEDALEDVEDDDVESLEDSIKDSIDKDDKGKNKLKLLDVVYSTPAKDNKDLKKVVCKVRLTSKPDDEDEDDEEDSIWKKEKQYTSVQESYVTFILYKNKVIYPSPTYL